MKVRSHYRVFLKPILFILFAVLLWGIYSYSKMETSLFPNVIFPKITIIANNGEQPVDKMMITVTKPLELSIRRVNGITSVKSTTSRGSCTIEAYFDWDVDIDLVRTQLDERVNEVKNQLPPSVDIVIEAMSQNIYPVVGYTIESDHYGQIELKNSALFTARPLFSQVPGISNIIVRGGKTKEYVVAPDAAKLIALGLTPQDVVQALQNTNFIESNGLLSNYRRLYLSLTDTRINSIADIKNVVIRNDGHRIIRLADVSTIDLQEQQEFVRINANGHDAIILDLVKQSGVNLVDFANNAEARAAEIQKQLPKGMIIKPYYNQSHFVTSSIDSVLESIVEGLILAILVVILFLQSFRASLQIIIIIPIILALSIVVLHFLGVTLNIMSLGAIAASIGLIIDDAIVVIEQLHRIHEEYPDKNKHLVVHETMTQFLPAMVGSSLSTIVIFFPFVMMSGVAGSFFKELTLTMEITLVCSFLVTWIGLPVLHLFLGYRHKKPKDKPEDDDSTPKKQKLWWLVWFFDKPWYAICFIVLLVISSLFLVGKLQTGFLPELDEGSIVLDYITPAGTTLEASDAMLKDIDNIILTHPDVKTYMRRTGTDMMSSYSMTNGVLPPNYGDYLIQLKPNISKTTEQIIEELRLKVTAVAPALQIEFGQRIADLLGDMIGRPQPIVVKIFGQDRATLQELARNVQENIQKIDGVADVMNGIIYDGPSLTIVPDQEKLALFKITPLDLQQQLSIHNEGFPIGEVQEGEQMLRILLRTTNFQNNSVDLIKNQPIFAPDGSYRPLQYFANVQLSLGDPELTRENLKSCIEVTARLDNRDIGSAMNDIKRIIEKNIALPPSYNIEYDGLYKQQQASFNELALILFAAIILVFTVLLFLFRNLRISLLIILVSILGIGGSILVLYITGVQLNVGSYTGIIMIVGIIAENSIFTINQFQTSLLQTSSIDESINYAISMRIRPKLMTALCAILALTPLALGIGVGAQMQQPLAIAVIGGFVIALPLLLVVLPSLLRLVYKQTEPID